MARMGSITTLFFALVCIIGLLSGHGQTPNRPQPSESSTVHTTEVYPQSSNTQLPSYPTNYYMEETNPIMKQYVLYSDYGSGNMLYAYQLGVYEGYGTRNYLIRDDLGASFQYFEPYPYCSSPLTPGSSVEQSAAVYQVQFPAKWTWIDEANYGGSEKFHNKDDSMTFWTTYYVLGVSKQNPNVPCFCLRYTLKGSGFFLSIYDKFVNGAPPENVFDIPHSCHVRVREDTSRENTTWIPSKPVIAESFFAEITYVNNTFYVKQEPLKKAKLYRNYPAKKQLLVNQLGLTTNAGSYHQLLRMDKNKQYNYLEPFGSCCELDLNQDTPIPLDQPLFGWIKHADYSGVKEFQHKKVNMWTYTDNGTSTFYSLGVSRNNCNRPIFLYEMHTYYTYRRRVIVFEKFKPGLSSDKMFNVPQACLLLRKCELQC